MVVYTILYTELSIFKHMVIAPVEIFLMQSHFSGLFSVLHNNRTWFISSIAFSYFLFPLFILILKNIYRYFFTLFLMYLICSLLPMVTIVFSTDSIYFSPLFRMLEFFMGIVLSILFIKTNKTFNKSN